MTEIRKQEASDSELMMNLELMSKMPDPQPIPEKEAGGCSRLAQSVPIWLIVLKTRFSRLAVWSRSFFQMLTQFLRVSMLTPPGLVVVLNRKTVMPLATRVH